MKKLIILIIMLASIVSQAQDDRRNVCLGGNYLTASVGGGLHSMSYDMDHYQNDRDSRAGFSAGLGFQHFFSEHWGISTGLLMRYFTTSTLFNYSYSASDTDTDNEDYDHITIFEDFRERQTMVNLGLPIMAVCQKALGKRWRWTAGAGLRFSTQVYSNQKRTSGQIETQGYFDQYHLLLYGMENHWFMDYYDMSAKFKSNLQLSALCETGMNYVLKKNPRLELTFGLYGEYNFNDTHKEDGLLHFDYSTDTYNGALNTAEVNKVHPFAVGLKAGIRYRLVRNRKTVPTEPVEPEKPVVPDNPIVPTDPEIPVVPEVPVVPDTPSVPVIPDKPVIPELPDVPEVPEQPAKRIVINFDFDKASQIYAGDTTLLKEIVETLRSDTARTVTVYGHTDNCGSYSYNLTLGMRRAQAVKRELVRLGARPEQVRAVSKSYSEPLVPNNSPKNRAINRRAEIELH